MLSPWALPRSTRGRRPAVAQRQTVQHRGPTRRSTARMPHPLDAERSAAGPPPRPEPELPAAADGAAGSRPSAVTRQRPTPLPRASTEGVEAVAIDEASVADEAEGLDEELAE